MIGFFEKSTSNIPVDNVSSLSITITIKIIELLNNDNRDTCISNLSITLLFNQFLMLLSYAPLPGDLKFAFHPYTTPQNFPQMTKFNQNFLSLLTVQISIFRLTSLYYMDLYGWSFDPIPHCFVDGMIIFHFNS